MIMKFLNKNVDKVAHESLCNVIAWGAFVFSFLIIKLTINAPIQLVLGISILIGGVSAFTAGFIKEKGDSIFDKKDILANCIGILRFILQLIIIYFIYKHSF